MRLSCCAPREHTRRRFRWPRPDWSEAGYWHPPVSHCPRGFARYCRPVPAFVSTAIGCPARRPPWPWGHRAEHVVGLVDGVVVLAPGPAQSGGPAVSRGANLADEPRDTIVFDGVPVTARVDAPSEVSEESLWDRTALGRVALMTGAVSAIAAMTLRYSREREQFGRPIGRFQAVQAHLVTIHQQATVLASALDGAVDGGRTRPGRLRNRLRQNTCRPGRTAGDRGRASDTWRHRNDQGVSVALSHPSTLGLA